MKGGCATRRLELMLHRLFLAALGPFFASIPSFGRSRSRGRDGSVQAVANTMQLWTIPLNHQTDSHVGKVPKGTMGSQKVVHEYLIHPSELKGLAPGRAAFKSGGRYGRLILPGYFPNVDDVLIPKIHQIDRQKIPSLKTPVQIPPEVGEEVPF